jgi:hypothetical protein
MRTPYGSDRHQQVGEDRSLDASAEIHWMSSALSNGTETRASAG